MAGRFPHKVPVRGRLTCSPAGLRPSVVLIAAPETREKPRREGKLCQKVESVRRLLPHVATPPVVYCLCPASTCCCRQVSSGGFSRA